MLHGPRELAGNLHVPSWLVDDNCRVDMIIAGLIISDQWQRQGDWSKIFNPIPDLVLKNHRQIMNLPVFDGGSFDV